MNRQQSAYIQTYESGDLAAKTGLLYSSVKSCTLCPQNCRVDRTGGEKGKCKSGILPMVSSYNAHFGEESVLVGRNGSGTIFFTNCNLACIFCQNYDISHLGYGKEISYDDLAEIMLGLQERGCHNINFVSPSHMIYGIMKSLETAVQRGLNIPLVYNSGGYDSVETIEMLDGVFDIYMPDFKYMDPEVSKNLSGVEDYPMVAMSAIKEMHRQVGDLITDARGTALRGLLVRHLVLPNNLAATDRVIGFLADLSINTYLNIMDQYRPEYRARECFDLKRRVTLQEYDEAVVTAKKVGLHRLDKQ